MWFEWEYEEIGGGGPKGIRTADHAASLLGMLVWFMWRFMRSTGCGLSGRDKYTSVDSG